MLIPACPITLICPLAWYSVTYYLPLAIIVLCHAGHTAMGGTSYNPYTHTHTHKDTHIYRQCIIEHIHTRKNTYTIHIQYTHTHIRAHTHTGYKRIEVLPTGTGYRIFKLEFCWTGSEYRFLKFEFGWTGTEYRTLKFKFGLSETEF